MKVDMSLPDNSADLDTSAASISFLSTAAFTLRPISSATVCSNSGPIGIVTLAIAFFAVSTAIVVALFIA